MNEPIDSFKNRFNKALVLRDMKPTELAEKTRLSKSTISHYMSGYTKPKSDKLFMLASTLNVSEQWLMGLDVPMERENRNILKFDYEFDEAWDILEKAGYILSIANPPDDSLVIIKNKNGDVVALLQDYELVNRYESAQKKGSLTAQSLLIDSKYAFLSYINSLGYYLYGDDPEHKPFMSSNSITSCRLKHDTLDYLKLRIDSYAKATIDSELLSLKEDEIRQQRFEKEQLLRSLQVKNNMGINKKADESEATDSVNQTSCTIIPIKHFKNVEDAKAFLRSHKLLAAWEIDNLTDADIITMANTIWTEGN